MRLSHPPYRSDLDGLRGIAVLLVLAYHVFPVLAKGGFIGVDIFFVLSGYLISTIIFSNLNSKIFSFKEFYSRRVRRIFPALILVLIACYLFGWFVLWAAEYRQLGKHMAAGAGFISNFLLMKESGYFDKAADTKPLFHLWSLGIEEQFYIVFPVLVWITYKVRFNLLILLAIIFLISFNVNIANIAQSPMTSFYSPASRFWELIMGSLLSFFNLYKKDALAKFGWRLLPDFTSILGFLLIILSLGMIGKDSLFPGWWALLPTLGTVLIISAGPQASVNKVVLSDKLLVWFGLISYPLYLWHYPLLVFARILVGELSAMARVGIAIVSIFLAWGTYRMVERPLRFGSHNNIKVTLLCILMIAVGFIGFITYKGNGLPFRKESALDLLNQNQLNFEYSPEQKCIDLIGLNHEMKKKQAIFCSYSGAKENLKVALLGDSEANSLLFGLERVYKDKNIGIIHIGNAACPPFREQIGQNNWNKDCDVVNRKSYKYVLGNSSIKTVILGFFGRGIKCGVGKSNKDAELKNNNLLQSQLVFKDISALKNAGKNVVVIFDFLGVGIDPKDCMDRIFKTDHAGCNDLKTVYSDNILNWKNLLKDKNVCIFSVEQALKTGGFLNILDSNGVLLFRDKAHVSYNGSYKVAQAFMNSPCF